MKKILITLFSLVAQYQGYSQENTPPKEVSIIEVIANQEEFDRKEVAIAGYLVLEFEGTALYLSKEDYLHRITKNAIYVHIGEAFLNEQKFPENWEGEGYVQITGMFTTSFNGHFGMYSGSLLEISHLFFMRDSADHTDLQSVR